MLKKIIMFLTGFCVYITVEVCFRGYSYITMGVCGGLLFLLIDSINNKISWDLDILLQGVLGSCAITLCELIVGEVCLLLGKSPMWNYTNMPLNFDGVICVPFSLLWIGLSIVAVFIADAINYYVFKEKPVPYYKLFGKTIIKFKEKQAFLMRKKIKKHNKYFKYKEKYY